MEISTCLMAFHVAQVKHVIFLHRLILYTAAPSAYVNPRPKWFVLSAMSVLSHVVSCGSILKISEKINEKQYYQKN